MSYNRAYHGFFEDYAEMNVLDPKTGKSHIERVYIGHYYRHVLSDAKWRKLKIYYGISYAGALLCYILQFFNQSTGAWFMALPLAVLTIAMLWCGFYVCAYLSHGRDLKIRQYRERLLLQGAAAAGTAGFALALICQIVWFFRYRVFYGYGVLCLAADAAGAVLLYLLFRRESGMEYEKVSNHIKVPEGSYDIRVKGEE